MTKLDTERLDALLAEAASAVHVNFSVFKERRAALGWMLVDPPPPGTGRVDVPMEESVVGDPEGVPDAALF